MSRIRIDRLLVERGVGSRKAMGIAVRRGRVTVDGEVLALPNQKVDPTATILLDGEAVEPVPVLVAWHKPIGVVSTVADPWGREGLDLVLPAHWRASLKPVGRLDRDTSGLLLFCSDGQRTQRMLHPKHAAPRTYLATVAAVPDDLAAQLEAGVQTADGPARGVLESVEGTVLRVTVREGRHRIVRRMLHNAGASVLALHRIAHGDVSLGDLAERAWRIVDG